MQTTPTMQIEVTPIQMVLILIALQDYMRFQSNLMITKPAETLWFNIDQQRRSDEEFFKQSLDAGEYIVKQIARNGGYNV